MEAALKKFLEPQSVAVIRASATAGKGGNDIIRNIQNNDFRGNLYLVNPRGGEILGVRVFKSIADLPAGIDLAVLVLPASASIQALKECAERGMKAAVMVAGGFAEVDDQGEELQGEILKVIQETGMRVLGPNTSGLLSMPQNLAASFFPLGKVPRGSISYIALTGNFATHSMDLAWRAARTLTSRWGTPLRIDESAVGSMVSVMTPERCGTTKPEAVMLRDRLLFEHNIEVQAHARAGRVWVRLSAQVYNDDGDFDRLAGAI